jgi:glycosyltransferase involved in cell wall biosynthesis
MDQTSTPLISVVIPTYNHACYIGRVLQSVIDQSYSNWEVILVDNHSTDNTQEIVSSYTEPRIKYLKIHNNGVIAKSRNAGIEAAKGEWIAFLDSDDWWTSVKLQECYECFNDQVDLVYHDMQIVSDQPRYLLQKKMIKSWQVKPPVKMNLLLKGNCIVNSSVVVRKHFLEEIGGICEDEEMIAAEDYNTWLRISNFTDNFLYVPRKLGYYLSHSGSVSRKDMSHAGRCAVEEFIQSLSASQQLKLEANFRFTKGRFHFNTNKYPESQENLLFSLRHGTFMLRMKSVILLIVNWARRLVI